MAPLWIVCEDGDEYRARLARFLGTEFAFVRAGCAAELVQQARRGAAGAIVDLDFRRTPAALLVDENGAAPARSLSESERQRLARDQGIFAIRALRAAGLELPAILYADLDDAEQRAALTAELAPLLVVGSHDGLPQLAARMRALASRSGSGSSHQPLPSR
ncbi:MAG: hypothetical protein JXR83_15760 [Deltaproteobacteria bacterium]|nr:hypothetical protein [Deltaproteobacteria bacterium]